MTFNYGIHFERKILTVHLKVYHMKHIVLFTTLAISSTTFAHETANQSHLQIQIRTLYGSV